MTQPYKMELDMSTIGKVTSIVMDQEDFDKLCDDIENSGIFVANIGTVTNKELVDRIREAKHLPMMQRGTKTKRFFDKFGVETDLLCACVRGYGWKVLGDMGLT